MSRAIFIAILTRFMLFLALVMSLATPVVAQDKIPVFVKSRAAAGGFTDPSKAREDSVKDLVKRLKDSKVVRPVEAEGEALVVLDVLDRATTQERSFGGPSNRSALAVRLIAGEYSVEIIGESASKGILTGYGAAASSIVKQVDAWVRTNRARILALKDGK